MPMVQIRARVSKEAACTSGSLEYGEQFITPTREQWQSITKEERRVLFDVTLDVTEPTFEACLAAARRNIEKWEFVMLALDDLIVKNPDAWTETSAWENREHKAVADFLALQKNDFAGSYIVKQALWESHRLEARREAKRAAEETGRKARREEFIAALAELPVETLIENISSKTTRRVVGANSEFSIPGKEHLGTLRANLGYDSCPALDRARARVNELDAEDEIAAQLKAEWQARAINRLAKAYGGLAREYAIEGLDPSALVRDALLDEIVAAVGLPCWVGEGGNYVRAASTESQKRPNQTALHVLRKVREHWKPEHFSFDVTEAGFDPDEPKLVRLDMNGDDGSAPRDWVTCVEVTVYRNDSYKTLYFLAEPAIPQGSSNHWKTVSRLAPSGATQLQVGFTSY